MRRILAEPLVHFVMIGAALFALSRRPEERPASAPVQGAEPIILDAHVRSMLIDEWRRTHAAAPSPDELERIAGEWIDREILYREGLARGLDRNDPRIRGWVSEKMAFLLSAQVLIPEPTEAELLDYFETHLEDFTEAARLDFIHVFVDGTGEDARGRAAELLGLLRNGASPAGLGDTFSGGRHYRRRRLEDLARTFGDDFVRGLDVQAAGEWVMRPSRYGLHLLRIEGRTPAGRPELEDVRSRVKESWSADRRAEAVAKEMSRLRSRWEVVEKP